VIRQVIVFARLRLAESIMCYFKPISARIFVALIVVMLSSNVSSPDV
jgi:hypothetical protein